MMKHVRPTIIALAVPLSFWISAHAAAASSRGETADTADSVRAQQLLAKQTAPIHSQATLTRYLQSHDGKTGSAFDLLSPDSRQRLIDSMQFNETGIVSFSYADIERELSLADAYALLSLFGAQHLLEHFRDSRTTPQSDRTVRAALSVPASDHPRQQCPDEVTCSAQRGAASSTPDRYDQLVQLNESQRNATGLERSRAVIAEYTKLYPAAGDDIESLSAAELDDLFRATSLVSGYSFSRAHAGVMRHAALALEARGALSDWHIRQLAGAFLSSRDFDGAEWARSRWPGADLPALPRLEGTGGNILEPVNEQLLEYATIDPGATRIIAVVHPFCGPSSRALADIDSRPELADIKDLLTLLVAPEAELPMAAVLAWNAAHPSLRMRFMNNRSDWAILESLDTPTFHLVSGGKVVRTTEGWPNPSLVEFGHTVDVLRAASSN